MPKKSSSRPVPWGFKVLTGLEVIGVVILILLLFVQPLTTTVFGMEVTGVPAATYFVLLIVMGIATVIAFFQRYKWGFPLIMISSIFGILDLLGTIVRSSASGDNVTLFFSILFLVISIFITKYIYDRRWYFDK